jgi:hypothetical protein
MPVSARAQALVPSPQPLDFPPQPLDFGACFFDLPLLELLLLILRHELVADQGSGQEPQRRADQGPGRSATRGAADDGAGRRADAGADEAALLSLGERLRAACGDR